MLTKLLTLLEQNSGELNLVQLSRELNAQPAAVQGMIDTLINKGRLKAINPDCGICLDCPVSSACQPAQQAMRRYIVATRK